MVSKDLTVYSSNPIFPLDLLTPSQIVKSGLSWWLEKSSFFYNCGAANAGALDAALICTSLDILHYESAKLERLRLYAELLSDRQTVTILNAVLHDSIEGKHRLAKLMDLCVDLDSVSAPKSIPVPGGTPAHSAPSLDRLEAKN